MPRGGKRPGAGAPKGNLNAFKHGKHSSRLKEANIVLPMIPEFNLLMDIAMRRMGLPRSQRERAVRIMAGRPPARARDEIKRKLPHLAPEYNVLPDEISRELQRGRELYFALRRFRARLSTLPQAESDPAT